MAGSSAAGTAIGAQVVAQAAHWMALLQSGEASTEDEAACARWRAADAAHERAWQRMAAMGQELRAGLGQVPPSLARAMLAEAASTKSRSRRAALRTLAGLGGAAVAAGGAWVVADPVSWRQPDADYATRTGERRTIALEDGTRIVLNTATAIDVRYHATQRQVILRGGEIEVTTGHDPAARPFTLATRHGVLTPLGTRFIVRDVPGDNLQTQGVAPDSIAVTVLEGAVRITPRLGERSVRVDASQSSRFTATEAAAPVAMAPAESAWLDGMLVADHTPLPRLLAELGRYRRGLLRCDPALASLDVSGAFPLADTDAVLALLEEALPVRVRSVTRYWVTVAPR